MIVFYDIETLPDLAVRPEAIRHNALEARRKSYPRSKEATLEDWVDNPDNADAVLEVWRKGAVHRLALRVLTVAFAVDGGPVEVLTAEYLPLDELRAMTSTRAEAHLDAAEARLLHEVSAAFEDAGVYSYASGIPTWCTYNGNGFDHGALFVRALKYRIKPLARAIPHDKWGKKSLDLAEVWKGTDYRGRMNRLTEVVGYLGGVVQDGIMGSEVFAAWEDGRGDEVAAHCRADIDDLRYVYGVLADLGAL